MIDTNFDDLVQQLAARRDQLQAELDAAMDAHGVICRAHDLLAGTATIVTAKAAEAHPAAEAHTPTPTVAVVDDQKYLTPPGPQPPEWLADRWANVYPGTSSEVYQSAEYADTAAGVRRIGRVSLTGQWVPCDGKRVLA